MRRVLLVLAVFGVVFGVLFASVLVKLDYSQITNRASWQLPDRVMDALALTPGARVADIGAGDGYFTFRLADAVGAEGRVYAVDVDEGITDRLRREVESRGYLNIEVVLAETTDAGLPVAEIELAFVCNVYHHIDDRVGYFDALRRYLAADGRVAMVEVGGRAPQRWLSPAGHSTSVESMEAEMAQAGYRVVERFDFLPVQSFVIFSPRP